MYHCLSRWHCNGLAVGEGGIWWSCQNHHSSFVLCRGGHFENTMPFSILKSIKSRLHPFACERIWKVLGLLFGIRINLIAKERMQLNSSKNAQLNWKLVWFAFSQKKHLPTNYSLVGRTDKIFKFSFGMVCNVMMERAHGRMNGTGIQYLRV